MKGCKTLLSYILFILGLQWKSVYAVSVCSGKEFQCRNTRCVNEEWKCDGDDDCGDNSDEKGCPDLFRNVTSRVRPCDTSKYFQCKNLQCLPYSYTCDNVDDCDDNSDESEIDGPLCYNPKECPDHMFRCEKSGKCIIKDFICDGDIDCGEDSNGVLDSSDEGTDCAKTITTCDLTDFKCGNGRCIDKAWQCDFTDDCGDHSDERNCNTEACSTQEGVLKFKCKASGHCLHDSVRCNGENDCLDGSDEENCDKIILTTTIRPAVGKFESNSTVKSPSKITTMNTTAGPAATPGVCKPGYIQCPSDKRCVHDMWTCDGDFDCDDGYDESKDLCKCKEDEFQCANNKCIPLSLKCNGVPDCPGKDDETLDLCPESVDCVADSYHCKESAKCINMTNVCDGKDHCPNMDDEQVTCNVNECLLNNGGCSHMCIDTKLAFKCDCPRGFELSTNLKTCIEINECLTPGFCSQACVNLAGTFRCMCDDGYTLKADKRTCKVKGPRASIVFSSGKDIRQISTDFKEYKSVVHNTAHPISIDLDIKNNMVYWVDSGNGSLYRSHFKHDGVSEEIVKEVKPIAISLDWIGRKLYWTEEGAIKASNLDGTHIKTLIKGGVGEMFRAVAVYPEKGYLFWSDIGDQPKIIRAHLDGSNQMTLFDSSKIKQVSFLTMDRHLKRLYWSDYEKQHIASSKIDGTDLRSVIHVNRYKCKLSGIAIFEDFVYWTCKTTHTVNKVNKFTGLNKIEYQENFRNPLDIAIYHPIIQKQVNHPCQSSNGGCSHLCFVSRQTTQFKCGCPDTMQLYRDSKTCIPKIIMRTACLSGYQCDITQRCIARTNLCNGVKNCAFGDDEANCVAAATSKEPATKSLLYVVIGSSFAALVIILIILVLLLHYRKKRNQSSFSMAYEKETELIHDKDFEDNNSETAEVEIKYIAPVTANKKDNQNNSKKYNSKKEKKNFSNKNFDTPLQMSNVDCELMIDDYSSDSMSDDICYNDTQPILT